MSAMERRIKVTIRSLGLNGPVSSAQLNAAVGGAVSRALATQGPGVARSVTQATTREVSARLGGHPAAVKVR
jgi:hypothetical protein